MKHQIKITYQNFQLIATLAMVVMVSLQSFITPAHAANALIGQEPAIVTRTNQVRAEVGLPALKIDSRLMQSAAAKAQDMATKGYFDHGNPSGYRMAYWINSSGYTYSLAGENLAKGFSSLDRMINAWVASPSHYKNLVEPKFTDIGVGMAEGMYEDQPTLFVVQHFGVEATPIVKDTAPLVSVTAPLVESVAGASDGQTIINSGPISSNQPKISTAAPTASAINQATKPFELIQIAQASPLSNPPTPTQSPLQFWPIFALITLALVGYLDEYIPLWMAAHPKA